MPEMPRVKCGTDAPGSVKTFFATVVTAAVLAGIGVLTSSWVPPAAA